MNTYKDDLCGKIETIFRMQDKLPPQLARACFARTLNLTYGRLGEGNKQGFDKDVFDITDSLGGIPARIDSEGLSGVPGKRQPSVTETVTATVDRYKMIDRLRRVLQGMGVTAFYGGSMAYGPFYNVRSGSDASDVDMVVELGEGAQLPEDSFADLFQSEIFTGHSVDIASGRSVIFNGLAHDGAADLMSHKFPVINGEFDFSIHAMPPQTFAKIYSPDNFQQNADFIRYARDYRERPLSNGAVIDNTSTGESMVNRVVTRPLDCGVLSYIPYAALYGGGRYYVTGVYQDLFTPEPVILSGDGSQSATQMGDFVRAFHDRIESEKQSDPSASVRNTKPRRLIMPPEIPTKVLEELNILS